MAGRDMGPHKWGKQSCKKVLHKFTERYSTEGEKQSESLLTLGIQGQSLPTGQSWLWWWWWCWLEPLSWNYWSPGLAKNLVVKNIKQKHNVPLKKE